MTDLNRTLHSLLTDPQIAIVGKDAIKNMDMTAMPEYEKTLAQLRDDHFAGNLQIGFDRLFRAAATGDFHYPVYSPDECSATPGKEEVHLVWFPSDDPAADGRPYILVVPGGAFVNVWSISEGWPIAAHFNASGYHAFVLTYRVDGRAPVIPHQMDDFAAAIRMISSRAMHFHVQPDRYITCGFSAGGHLVSLWDTASHGYAAHDLPKPQATFAIYPFISWKLAQQNNEFRDECPTLLGCSLSKAVEAGFEIPDQVASFPPCAIFLAAGDDLVSPEHSRLLKRALDAAGIPCRLEIG